MDIYKLSDEILEKKISRRKKTVGSVELADSDGSLRITNLKQGVKNPNRVNVFVNDEYSFSLDVAQVVELSVKVGREISEKELKDFKRASEYGKLYQRTLEWVLSRPHSRREVEDYLRRKLRGTSTEADRSDDVGFSKQIIERLTMRGYLDDQRFAEWYVENRFVKKGVSKKRLRMELMKKGIAKGVIDDVLDRRNDEEELIKMIERKKRKYDDADKLISYLCRQGFPYELVKEKVLNCEMD